MRKSRTHFLDYLECVIVEVRSEFEKVAILAFELHPPASVHLVQGSAGPRDVCSLRVPSHPRFGTVWAGNARKTGLC